MKQMNIFSIPGIEISVQTTPSLAKTTTTPTSAADKPEIAAPKFESPPQPEAKIIEKKAVIETKPVVESVETDGMFCFIAHLMY